MSERNLNAYYYEFFGTGSDAIDSILESVARAGKAYHHTGEWGPSGEGDNTPSDWIQEAANIAAERERERMDGDRKFLAEIYRHVSGAQEGNFVDYQHIETMLIDWIDELDNALATHKQAADGGVRHE